jgi:hypothetical protein
VETALENLPDTVIQDVTVTFSGEAQTSPTSKAGFLVTFVNPSNTNGNLLSVGSAGCNQAGCSPRYSGVFTRTVTDQTFNGLSTSVYGGANYTVSGIYTGQLYRDEASVISKDASPGKAIVDIAITTDNPSGGGTADQFTVTWNKATSGTATAITNSAISLGRGLTINFLDPTDWYTGTDKISFNIGKGQVSAAVTDATSGTKKEWNVCSGRGVCDSENGICGCFSGYTGEACAIQTVLV